MHAFNCDICGKQTHINPPTEPIFEIGEGGKKRQVLVELKSMDFNSGKVVSQMVPKLKDLKPRAHLIKLNAGIQSVQRDFCDGCLEQVMPEVKALWEKLERIGNR